MVKFSKDYYWCDEESTIDSEGEEVKIRPWMRLNGEKLRDVFKNADPEEEIEKYFKDVEGPEEVKEANVKLDSMRKDKITKLENRHKVRRYSKAYLGIILKLYTVHRYGVMKKYGLFFAPGGFTFFVGRKIEETKHVFDSRVKKMLRIKPKDKR